MQEDEIDMDLTPKQVVDRLDRYIVGQVKLPQSCRKACPVFISPVCCMPCVTLKSHT